MMSAETHVEEQRISSNNSDADKENIRPPTEDQENIPPAKKQKVVKTKVDKTKNKEQKKNKVPKPKKVI